MIGLDTNVQSELMHPEPNPVVLAWLSLQEPRMPTTTAITVAAEGWVARSRRRMR